MRTCRHVPSRRVGPAAPVRGLPSSVAGAAQRREGPRHSAITTKETAMPGSSASPESPAAPHDPAHVLDLTEGRRGAAPLFLLPDGTFSLRADAAAAAMFKLADAEQGDPTARPALRAHAILLLQQRGPALNPADRVRAASLVRTLVRAAPPYDKLGAGAWSFAMCNGYSFHDGECDLLSKTHGFKEVPAPQGAPQPPAFTTYR